MCYYVASKLSRKEIYSIGKEFNLEWEEESFEPYYSVSGFSHPKLPIITGEGHLKLLRWGLIPCWVKDWKTGSKWRTQTLNAIGDTIDSKPSFRGAVKSGRFCIIPLNGFYEWHHHSNGNKYPHYIYPKEKSCFWAAGLYEKWTNQAIGEVHNTFTIITTHANSRMEWIHNTKKRMPAILTLEGAKAWLDQDLAFSQKKQLLEPYNTALMADHTIGKLITSRKENPNQQSVMEHVVYPELPFS